MMHSTLSSQLKSVQLSEVSSNSSSWAWRGGGGGGGIMRRRRREGGRREERRRKVGLGGGGGGGGVEPSNVDTIGTNKYVLISFIFQLLDSMKLSRSQVFEEVLGKKLLILLHTGISETFTT